MFDLIFLFTGLSVFALDTPTSPAERLDVVLVSAAQHAALLVVSEDQVLDDHLLNSQPIGDGDSHLAYPLAGRIVRVVGRPDGQVTWSPRPGADDCPSVTTRDSYGWVVPFDRMAPGYGQIRNDMRFPDTTQPPHQVAAKVELESGTLKTAGFARTEGGRVLLFRHSGGTVVETAAADLVEVRQRDLQGAVTLELAAIDGSPSGWLYLKDNGKREILVEIFNQPPGVVCCRPTDKLGKGAVNAHFCHLFDVLPPGPACSAPVAVDHCPSLPPDPSYAGACVETCQIAAGNPQCPGGDGTGP